MRSIGILVAMREELQSILQLWPLDWTGPGDFYSGKCGSVRIQVALSGAGLERAQDAARQLARLGAPNLLLSVGLSGGLKRDLKVGDLVLASHSQVLGGEPEVTNQELLERVRQSYPCRVGGLLSLPVVLCKPGDKAIIAAACPEALALDMESYSLAQTAAEHKIPWLALRAVSDSLHESLPLDFNKSMNEKGQVSRLRLIGQLIHRPAAVTRLIRFSGHVQRAQASLLKGLDNLLGAVS